MGWHEAYLRQARSDYSVLRQLDDPGVEYCHRLHYLHMASEKLAKGILTPPGSENPIPPSHAVLVRMLRALKGRRDLRQSLGYRDAASFNAYIDSLLTLARRIEQLSPDQAGLTRPNPEYPWRASAGSEVVAPAEYAFDEFHPADPAMQKLGRLIQHLLRFAW